MDIDTGAAAAIRTLTDAAGVGQRGGLRITWRGPARPKYDMAVVDEPSADDLVVLGRDGVRVFLDAESAQELDGKVLDVIDTGTHFRFGARPPR
ncbi:adhesin [Actinokineospora auranticolor]|uniref:Fe-S cluster assembly iron-binding protein IscA n=1 Tax=Actinokineospora auranticolor TaxID=155976 RepID=A0A2S6GEY1_9PSEU|nr:hypothetical protein [Actinokineospora auranticolor]PPK63798.1 Fe-S cluster assembly iron-binding protein IscA [Actinokineospora auranticolor]